MKHLASIVFIALCLGASRQAEAAPQTLQITLGSSATQVATTAQYCRWIVFQNNATHNIRIGDAAVSSTRGIQLASGTPGGSFTLQPQDSANNGYPNLAQWYIAGTPGDVIDVVCDVVPHS